ncbi:SDR family oxidoreductase [Microbacterium sp. NPDC089696]|uniref:SDR family oxidoreductase n=1 Tax=Microbacterium sp. NPDC089696 TaxID=3364199 RepID=UPI0038013C8C
MKISGNTILITGGTSGIGRAFAESLHDRGNRVIITGRRQPLLDEITAERPGILGLQLDVGDRESLRRVADLVGAEHPELNVLVTNAGVSRPEDVVDDHWDISDAEAVVDANVLGVMRTTAAFLPILKESSDATIIATGSALAFVPLAGFPAYCASKAFLHSWLTSLRHQLRETPIEVIELLPPYLRTALTGSLQAEDPRAMPVDEYIAAVMDALEREDHPNGEILLERDHARRWAERDGAYAEIFAAMNPR